MSLIVILGIYSMYIGCDSTGGFIQIFASSENALTFTALVGLVIGSFISGGTATPSFLRFAKSKSEAVFTTVFAFFVGNSLIFLFGATAGAIIGALVGNLFDFGISAINSMLAATFIYLLPYINNFHRKVQQKNG